MVGIFGRESNVLFVFIVFLLLGVFGGNVSFRIEV